MGVSLREIDKFVFFGREKIFCGVCYGAECISTIFQLYSPFPEGLVHRELGVILWKTRKILFFLETIFHGVFMVLNAFLPIVNRVHPSQKGLCIGSWG